MKLIIVFFVALIALVMAFIIWFCYNLRQNNSLTEKNLKKNRALSILERYNK